MATEITTTENTSMAPTVTTKPIMALAFDTTTGEGKKRFFNALNTAESLNDADIKQLTLSGIIVQPTERLDQATGDASRELTLASLTVSPAVLRTLLWRMAPILPQSLLPLSLPSAKLAAVAS